MKNIEKYASVKSDAWSKHLHGARRQENAKSVESRFVSANTYAGYTRLSYQTKTTIFRDFSTNLDLDYAIDVSLNFESCRKLVLAYNPKKKSTQLDIMIAERAYYAELENFNICKNPKCLSPIKIKKAKINCLTVSNQKTKTIKIGKRTSYERTTITKGTTIYYAIIPRHYEVFYCDKKRGLRIRIVEAYKFDSKDVNKFDYNGVSQCSCDMVKIRRADKKRQKLENIKTLQTMYPKLDIKGSKVRIMKPHIL